jgi:hypothetical protein
MGTFSLRRTAIAALFACALPSAVDAASLVGNTINAEYRYPDFATTYCSGPGCFTPNPFLVGPGVESISLFGFTVDFDASSLTIVLPSATSGFSTQYINAAFNGPVFSVALGNPFGSIVSVSGLDLARVLLQGGELYLNFQGITFANDHVITVTLDNVAAVPVPAALPLFATGLAGLGWLARRKKRQTSAAA